MPRIKNVASNKKILEIESKDKDTILLSSRKKETLREEFVYKTIENSGKLKTKNAQTRRYRKKTLDGSQGDIYLS